MRGRIALLLGLAMLPAGAIAMQVGFNAAAARQAAYEETLGRRALESIAVERRTIDGDDIGVLIDVADGSMTEQQYQYYRRARAHAEDPKNT